MKCLWEEWSNLEKRLQSSENILLFLDYDGTLVNLKNHPSLAKLSKQTKKILEALSRQSRLWMAIVSGRSLKDLEKLIGISNICCIGNHGLELRGPNLQYENPVAKENRPFMNRLAAQLEKALEEIQGAWVENKGLTLTVHTRLVSSENQLAARNLIHETVRPLLSRRRIQLTYGKEVYEIRPPVRWTKGTIIQWLLARDAMRHEDASTLPIYLGDDQTDEHAFEVLKKSGITVLVGQEQATSIAKYKVNSPKEVHLFLKKLLAHLKRHADVAQTS